MDDERIIALEMKLLDALKGHLVGEPDRDRVYEALNAFANVVAIVLASTGNHKDARRFFRDALAQQRKVSASVMADMNLQGGTETWQ